MEAKKQKDTRFVIRTDGELKEKVTAYCEKHGITLSDFIRVAATDAMRIQKIRERIRGYQIEAKRFNGGVSIPFDSKVANGEKGAE